MLAMCCTRTEEWMKEEPGETPMERVDGGEVRPRPSDRILEPRAMGGRGMSDLLLAPGSSELEDVTEVISGE